MRIPFFKLLLLTQVSLMVASSLTGQTEKDPFEGIWTVTPKTSDPMIVLLKPKGEASYFLVKNNDRTVHQGEWSVLEGVATARWQDGSEHRFRQGAFDLVASYRDAEGVEMENISTKAVPAGILGQWAKPPERSGKDAEDRANEDNFFGLWQMKARDGEAPVFVMVSRDRSAATNVGGADLTGLHGSWIKQGSELHLIWENGDYSILREAARGHDYTRAKAGLIIEDAARDFEAIARTAEANAPQDWLAAYRAQQEEAPSGYVFSSRKAARNFYRGNWLIQHESGNFERIMIRRYGGLDTSRDRSLNGDWLLSGQNIMLRWDDGMRKILSPAGRGFVYYSYAPGQPLDGVPTRIRPATPENAEKLTRLMAGRKVFSDALLERAQEAGINPAEQVKAGPMNWIWPFSRNKTIAGEALLTQEDSSKGSYSNDPWWWPLWSDQASKNEPEEKSMGAELDATPESPNPLEASAMEPLREKKRGWYWPF